MLKRLFAPRKATRPVALHFLTDSGPHITLRDLTRHLALIGPPAQTLQVQQHLAAQLLTRHLPVSALCVPNDPARPTLPPPSLVLTATPEQGAEQLAALLRRSLEHRTTSSPPLTNLLLYTPRVPPQVTSEITVLMRLWRSCAVYSFTPEQLLSTRMAAYRFKLDTLFASAVIWPCALKAYQTCSGVPLNAVPAGHAALIIRGGPLQFFPLPVMPCSAVTPSTLSSGHSTDAGRRSQK